MTVTLANTPYAGTGDAAANLGEAARLVASAFVCVTASVLMGSLLALWLRRRGLAWTWALASLGPIALVACGWALGVLPGLAVATVSAVAVGFAVGAVGLGAHLELEDRRAGGDRATAARERRGVCDGLRRWAREHGGGAATIVAGQVPVGRTAKGELAGVPRGSKESGCHVLIPGATGAGKTTSLAALLVEYVARSGFGSVVLEAKIDASLCEAARGAAAARGVPFRLVTPSGPCGYDPMANGSIDERSERLVSAQTWGSDDADFYRQAASPFLRLVLRVLEGRSERVTLSSVAEHCDPDGLANLTVDRVGEDLMREATEAVACLRADERRAIAGLHARLRNLASSEFARSWLDPLKDGVHSIDLREAIAKKEVVYFRFDTDRTGNVGRAIAQMVLLDLGAAASALMGSGVGTFVAIDEFGALESPALDRLYARGRAAGFSVAVGTQTLADLRAAGPAVRERVGATVSAVVCHRIGGQADAEWVAQLIGAVPSWQSTIRTNRWGYATDQGTRSRGYRYEVNPAELQRLGRGEAVVACLDGISAKRSARARVVPAWERLASTAA